MSAYRLSVVNILVEAFRLCFGNIGIFSRALAIPILVMAATVIYWRGHAPENPSAVQLLIPLWWSVWFTLFAITCHRLALLGPNGVPMFGHLRWGLRELVFLSRLLLMTIGLPVVAFSALFLLLTPFIPDMRAHITSNGVAPWLGWIVFAGVIYFVARWSLVFPAAATDQPLDFAGAWTGSRGNGWRLAVVVGFIPAALELARALLLGTEPPAVALVINLLIGYALLAVQVVALSLAYQAIRRAPQSAAQHRVM